MYFKFVYSPSVSAVSVVVFAGKDEGSCTCSGTLLMKHREWDSLREIIAGRSEGCVVVIKEDDMSTAFGAQKKMG